MFRRFQVMDLFSSEDDFKVKEWVNVKDKLPNVKLGIFMVRLANANEVKAYFCEDKLANLAGYKNITPTHWWDKETKHAIYDVVEWGKN